MDHDNYDDGVWQLDNEIKYVGFIQMSKLVLYDDRITAAQKILYMVLCDFARGKDYCFPGVARLSKCVRQTKENVRRNLKALEELGFIYRQFRLGQSTIYKMLEEDDIYGGGTKLLTDESIHMLSQAGADALVNRIEKSRELSAPDGKVVMHFVGDEKVVADDGLVQPEVDKPSYEKTMAKIQENTDKSSKARTKRDDRRQGRKNDPEYLAEKERDKEKRAAGEKMLKYSDVEKEFRTIAAELWPETPTVSAAWGIKERSIAKNLCERFGTDNVIKSVVGLLENWEDYVYRYNLHGYPNIRTLAGFAHTWIPELTGKRIEPSVNKRKRAREEREWQDDSNSDQQGGISFEWASPTKKRSNAAGS